MKFDIYAKESGQVQEVLNFLKAVNIKDEHQVNIVDLSEALEGGLPAKVLNQIMEFQQEALPLTLAEGRPYIRGKLPTESEINDYVPPVAPVNRSFAGEEREFKEDTAVSFKTPSRVHMNMIVKSVKESVGFYRTLFGQEPTKLMEDYAKFELEDPPVNLALQEDPHGGAHGHFGVQVKSSDIVRKAMSRYADAGFYLYEESETSCCYAVQTKTWVADPDGNQWEVFVVTDNSGEEGCASDCICYEDMKPSLVKSN